MPVIKPVYTATATAPASGGVITTAVNPAISLFYAAITAGMITTDTTIPAARFVDDAGGPVVALPALTADDYYNVYVNGVLQLGALSTLSTASLVLDATDIGVGVPVLLEVASFSNATSTQTTPPRISAPTITIFT